MKPSASAIQDATPLAVAAFAYLLMILIGKKLLGDPDTFLHIAAGNWIWAHGSVPPTDPFSFTFRGAPWVAHEWLSELIFAGTFAALGWVGVVAATATAVALAFGLLVQYLGYFLPRSGVLLAIMSSFLLLAPHLVARPHVLAMPVLVAWIICLERARVRSEAPPFLALTLMTLWANLHGGFVIGLGLVAIYAIEATVIQPAPTLRWKAARGWSVFLVCALVAALITPYGIDGPLLALRLSRETFALSVIREWSSTDFASFPPIELWIMALIALGFFARIRLPPMKLLLLLGLLHAALLHRRNADVLALIAPALLAEPLMELFPKAAPSLHKRAPRMRDFVAAALVVAIATGTALWHGIDRNDQRTAPTHALAAAKAAGVTGPVLNAYNFGGYLIFAGIPPFVDGRVDLYGDAFMRNYIDAVSAQGDALPQLLERYHIAWTLLEPSMAAVGLLDHAPGWERVYGDSSAVIHRRVAAAPSSERKPSLP
jgi:hypothetical protein